MISASFFEPILRTYYSDRTICRFQWNNLGCPCLHQKAYDDSRSSRHLGTSTFSDIMLDMSQVVSSCSALKLLHKLFTKSPRVIHLPLRPIIQCPIRIPNILLSVFLRKPGRSVVGLLSSVCQMLRGVLPDS